MQEQALAAEQHTNALADWHKAKELFDHEQTAYVEAEEGKYLSKDQSALLNYWKKILENPVYLEQTPCVWSLRYSDENSRLIVEYALPPISQLPRIEEVRYRPDLGTLEEVQFSSSQMNYLYGDLLIKTTLIALFKLFQSDAAGALKSIAFNGTVTVIDRATGHPKSPCIVAIEVEKSAFSNINFAQIDPVACFKGLQGKISAKFFELDPISPIT